jgi:hypothetical protein
MERENIKENIMINNENLKQYLLKRISHANNRFNITKELHGDNPNEKYTYFGGQTLGYWQGMVTAYQNVLDEVSKGVCNGCIYNDSESGMCCSHEGCIRADDRDIDNM